MSWLFVATLIVWVMCLAALIGAWRAGGVVRQLKRLLGAAVWGFFAVVFSALLMLLQAFQAFSSETLVARVTTRRLAPEVFELTYTPTAAGGAPIRTELSGDQWAISGGVIKWHPWLTALGVKSYHKPLRLSGQFADVSRQRSQPSTIYALAPSIDRVWEAFYWMDRWLPFVEAVYGSAAYAYVEPGVTQDIYVTASSYLIKRATYPTQTK